MLIISVRTVLNSVTWVLKHMGFVDYFFNSKSTWIIIMPQPWFYLICLLICDFMDLLLWAFYPLNPWWGHTLQACRAKSSAGEEVLNHRGGESCLWAQSHPEGPITPWWNQRKAECLWDFHCHSMSLPHFSLFNISFLHINCVCVTYVGMCMHQIIHVENKG